MKIVFIRISVKVLYLKANNTDLAILSAYYHIDWKECRCLKGVKLEDVTPELDSKAYAELKNNKH